MIPMQKHTPRGMFMRIALASIVALTSIGLANSTAPSPVRASGQVSARLPAIAWHVTGFGQAISARAINFGRVPQGATYQTNLAVYNDTTHALGLTCSTSSSDQGFQTNTGGIWDCGNTSMGIPAHTELTEFVSFNASDTDEHGALLTV
jgi:hypothetical protein